MGLSPRNTYHSEKRKKRCGRLDPYSEFFYGDRDPFGSILGSDDDEEASERMAAICGDSG